MIFTIFGFCSEFAAMTGDAKTNDRVDVPSPWDTSTTAQPETAIPNRQPNTPNTLVRIKTVSLLGITSTRASRDRITTFYRNLSRGRRIHKRFINPV